MGKLGRLGLGLEPRMGLGLAVLAGIFLLPLWILVGASRLRPLQLVR